MMAKHNPISRRPLRRINSLVDYGSRPWYDREKLFRIIFLTDTYEGFFFDIWVIVLVLLSVSAVFLDTIVSVHSSLHPLLSSFEWICTGLFTIEYLFRLYASRHRVRYALSFFGLVDLFSFLPTYLSGAFFGLHYMLVLRLLRIMRIFKIFRMSDYIRQGRKFAEALRNSSAKIGIFMLCIVILVSILGSIMYVIESPVNPNYSSIPRAIYWAMITLTTVGYGDITPITPLGQFVSTVVMLLGYSIIAVPTGIISAEVTKTEVTRRTTLRQLDSLGNEAPSLHSPHCPRCGHTVVEYSARYCSRCGRAFFGSPQEDLSSESSPKGGLES